MKYEQMDCLGEWNDIVNLDQKIGAVLKRESWFAPRMHREPMTTPSEVFDALNRGEILHHGNDWYDKLRASPSPAQLTTVEMVLCDCGHTVPQAIVMNANLMTSCPDCYDNLSE